MQDEYLSKLEAKAREQKLSMRLWLSRAGVAQSTFYRWKNGKTRDAKLSTIRRLERALEPVAEPAAEPLPEPQPVAA